jgi:dynein intermediate chain 1
MGTLYVWDLNQEKHTYMCEHPAMKKARGLHIAFNDTDPIILVGDDRGGVNSFKLSLSLTKGPEVYIPTKEEEANEKAVFPTT